MSVEKIICRVAHWKWATSE